MSKDKLNIVLPPLNRRDFIKLACIMTPGLIPLLSGCKTTMETPTQDLSTTDDEPEMFRLFTRLSWIKSAQWANLFVALDKGFYADEGLDVTLFPGGSGIDPIPLVSSGSDHIGVQSSGIHLINARSQGIPVKCFAAFYQKHPMGFMSLKESNISDVSDFVGKKIGSQVDSIGTVKGVLEKHNIPVDDVEIVTVSFDPTPLLSGQVDVYVCWKTNQPYQVEQAGHEWNFISMWDAGGKFYAVTPFTTEKMLTEKPEVIAGFLKASLRGLQYVLDNPDEAVDITLKLGESNLEKEHQRWLLSQANPLCSSEDTEEIGLGWMRKEVWEEGRDSLLEMGTIEETFEVDDLLAMEPLKEVHGIS